MTVGTVLVVDDDPTVAEVTSRYLEREGFVVGVATDGPSAIEAAARLEPDLVILDVLLPGLHGLDVLARLRRERPVPVILLTAKRLEADRIAGLELGADDYVSKPFSPRELVARVRAVLRRATPDTPAPDRLRVGPVELDEATRSARVRDEEVTLTSKEFDLLRFLLRHPHQAFRREELLERVWGWSIGDTSTVTVHVRHLREKIEADPASPTLLRTLWGVGYRFDPPEEP